MRKKQASKQVDALDSRLSALTTVFLSECPDCRHSFYACQKHIAFMAAVNRASTALGNVAYELERLENV